MAYDKIIIDSAKFEGAVKATADAIRAKTRGTAKLPWDESTGFASSVSAITPRNQSKTVTPKASSQTVKPDSGYDGLSQVTVNGDSNLKAANIKKGTSIFGVAGTLETGAQIAEGEFTACTSTYEPMIWKHPITISGLAFKPSRVIFYTKYAVSNHDGVLMYDSGTNFCVGRWNEEYYDEYEDEYYDDIYCGKMNLEPTVAFTSDGFKVSATEEGEWRELSWFPEKYHYIAIA